MRGIASFIAGFGDGYFKADDKKRARERQEKLDAQANELHTARMAEITDAQNERQNERDFRNANTAALSTGKTDTGQVVTDAAGSNAFTKDADAAAFMQDMAQAKNGGAQTAPATRVLTGMQGATQRGTIPGEQVFTDPAKAQEFAQSMSMSEYAKLQARKAVAEQYGKLDIADDLRVKLENLAQKGVFKASSLLDAGNADGALKVLQDMNPELVPNGAQFKQVDVPDMFDRSKTTKGWALVVPGAEGQPERVLVGDFRDAVFGYLTPQERIGQENKVRELRLKERELEEVKIPNAETQRELATIRSTLAQMRAGGGGSGSGGRAGAQDGGGTTSFDPLAQFDSKKAQAVAFEQAAAAVDANGKPLSPAEQGKLAQEIYRSMEDAFATENTRRQRATVFLTEARNASTPEEIEAVRQRAAASGYTDAEMAALDKRFAAKAPEPANEQEATTRSSADARQPEPKPAPSPSPAYGRPATMASFFGGAMPSEKPAAAPAPKPAQPNTTVRGKLPTSFGDEYTSYGARQALAARVEEASKGGPPLTAVESLRARQLRLMK